MSTEQTREMMMAYGQTLMGRGPYSRYFAEDITFTVVGTGHTLKGRAAVEQFIRNWHEQAFDAQPELMLLLIDGDHAAAEARTKGTHRGEFMGMPATGRYVDAPYSMFYDIEGGKITAFRAYADALLQQLRAATGARQTA